MPVFETMTCRLPDDEVEEYRLQEEDSRWWSKQPIESYVGKYVAVVNREAFVGDTWEEAEQQALTTYPHRRPVVEYVPRITGHLIL
jgi:hypothetical protein